MLIVSHSPRNYKLEERDRRIHSDPFPFQIDGLETSRILKSMIFEGKISIQLVHILFLRNILLLIRIVWVGWWGPSLARCAPARGWQAPRPAGKNRLVAMRPVTLGVGCNGVGGRG